MCQGLRSVAKANTWHSTVICYISPPTTEICTQGVHTHRHGLKLQYSLSFSCVKHTHAQTVTIVEAETNESPPPTPFFSLVSLCGGVSCFGGIIGVGETPLVSALWGTLMTHTNPTDTHSTLWAQATLSLDHGNHRWISTLLTFLYLHQLLSFSPSHSPPSSLLLSHTHIQPHHWITVPLVDQTRISLLKSVCLFLFVSLCFNIESRCQI